MDPGKITITDQAATDLEAPAPTTKGEEAPPTEETREGEEEMEVQKKERKRKIAFGKDFFS